MTVVNNASVIFKDKNGNVGTVKGASANDITKISNAISDVAQVVNPTTHLPINATTSSVGVVQLADSAAVSAGTSGRVVDAAQLKDAIEHVTPAGNLMTLDTAQTVTAVKTFSSLPESSVVPTTNNQLVNKKYVDDHTPTGVVDLTSAQTISGLKTFSTLPQSSVAPSSGNDLVNKTYVDGQVDVNSTYTEPVVSKGILSPATNRLTPPSTAQDLAIPQSHFPGEIIISTVPVTDANVHLADGALLDGAGSYADFVEIMAAKAATNPELFVTEADWQTSVTNTGSCGKYVYDSVNNTVRIPKLDARYLKSTLSASDLGDLVQAGAPNIKGEINGLAFSSNHTIQTGALSPLTSASLVTSATSIGDRGLSFDASQSNPIYKDSATTIDTDAVKYYFYIVVGTVSKLAIQVDIDQIATDLNGKAGVDFANINNTAKIAIAHNAMPSNVYDDLTLGANGATYTAPADGFFFLQTTSSGTDAVITLTNTTSGLASRGYTGVANYLCIAFIPCFKGDSIKIEYFRVYTGTPIFRFIYAVGSESEKA